MATTINTYGALAEEIITEYYKKFKNDNSNYTIRHIAEQVAQEVAMQAFNDAVLQDRLSESIFANDQFITSYTGLSITTLADGRKGVPLPNQPAGLPKGRELAYIGFTGNKKTQVFPMRNKDLFMQQLTPTPKWMILAYIEGQNVFFENLSSLVTANVDMKLVGAVGTGQQLVDTPLNMPKQMQSIIMDKVLSRMNPIRNVLPDNVNDDVSK